LSAALTVGRPVILFPDPFRNHRRRPNFSILH
jgi:hypothetical protein